MSEKEKSKQPKHLSLRERHAQRVEKRRRAEVQNRTKWILAAMLIVGGILGVPALADAFADEYQSCTEEVTSTFNRSLVGSVSKLYSLTRTQFESLEEQVRAPLIEVRRSGQEIKLSGVVSTRPTGDFLYKMDEDVTFFDLLNEMLEQTGAEHMATVTHGKTILLFYFNPERTVIKINEGEIVGLLDWAQSAFPEFLEPDAVTQHIILENLTELPLFPDGSKFQGATYKKIQGGESFSVINLAPGEGTTDSVLVTELMQAQLRLPFGSFMQQELIANTASAYYGCVVGN